MACSTARTPLLGKSVRGISYPKVKNVPALAVNGRRQQLACRRSLDTSFVQGKLATARRGRALVVSRAEGDAEGEEDTVPKAEPSSESNELEEEDASAEIDDAAGIEVEQPQRRQRRRGPPRGRRAQAKGPQLDERVVQVDEFKA